MKITTVSYLGVWITRGWLILSLVNGYFSIVFKAMTINVQKNRLLHEDSSDFMIILLNKINTEVWNTVPRSQVVIFQGSIKKK